MPFKPGQGRESFNLSESEIRYAMSHTKSNRQAARFLRVSVPTYRKYAKQYIDSETDKNLYELHKNQSGKNVIKTTRKSTRVIPIFDILDGKYPDYSRKKLKNRLIRDQIMTDCCSNCGFSERRVSDYSVPIILHHKDGNKKNHKLENLEFLCFNCYYLFVGKVHGNSSDWNSYLI